MTCIVGLEFEGKVILAGDVQGSGGNSKIIHTQPKVFNRNGVLFGYTTSYRFGQMLEHRLQEPIIPERTEEVYKWLITTLIPDIQSALKEADNKGGNCLIGVKGQLWELQNDYSVLRSVRAFNAVGSGEEYAMGSMLTALQSTPPRTILEAEKIVRDAIIAAGTFSPTVGTDSIVVTV